MDLSVIIVSFNTRELLGDCLHSVAASLARTPEIRAETWVVDNASLDGSADLVREEFPWVHLTVSPVNVGFAAANNLAIRQSSGRYVLLLNSDTVVRGDALACLVRFLDEHPRAGAAGARLLNPDGSRQQSCFRFPTLWMSLLDFFPINHRLTNSRLNGRYPEHLHGQEFSIDHPLGACLLVRREVVEQVGLLDEGFFMYCEEIDWCLRIRRYGWDILYAPEPEIIHYGGQSTRQFRSRMFVELHRSRVRLFEKHYSPWFTWLHRQIVRLGVSYQALLAWWAGRRGDVSPSELHERLSAYWQVACLSFRAPPPLPPRPFPPWWGKGVG
ncbi:MAG: glycosyltransferase family 2 protein [Chloroflexi bacterium]|nr:glycosyltransferase family 2 protein [Chloroflexota bacterium]